MFSVAHSKGSVPTSLFQTHCNSNHRNSCLDRVYGLSLVVQKLELGILYHVALRYKISFQRKFFGAQ